MTASPELSVQLYTLREALAEDADRTLGELAELGFTQVEPIGLPQTAESLKPSLTRYGLTAPTAHGKFLEADQDAAFSAARDLGIQTLIHYPIPPHRQAAYATLGFAPDAFPIASAMADEVLSLPIGPHLSDAAQDRVIDALLTPGLL